LTRRAADTDLPQIHATPCDATHQSCMGHLFEIRVIKRYAKCSEL
jgi:hypothetical protein